MSLRIIVGHFTCLKHQNGSMIDLTASLIYFSICNWFVIAFMLEINICLLCGLFEDGMVKFRFAQELF